ncbi:signal transduction histidine kinase, solute sensing [Sulfurimonas gotlandica GD1]|uniref:histidine kinase n=1 Tax=Sulfurimonas gotlandica (strain DSM 19862 / JCM 16533 / GD1) TaxID=929558 RepID=B6BH30_SULGG|nr:ABC transporter substrate-binding protein [Sulfurimonas gotlandica]EDZ62855.1 histidine kinase [Sulfurimonas gotlandica GD1]EHP29818.1 signal transduction histidine kinase, solute sensing [Sulfurimonas gotlandica GD1]
MKALLLLVIFIFTLLSAAEKPSEKVSLQLMWLDQFQFAGYYMAKEKGFYKEVDLDVDIKKFKYSMDSVEEVLNGRATYGIGRSGLIKSRSEGKKIVLLSAIFQSSPFMLVSLASSNINSVKDFATKRLMLTKDAVESASIRAMIMSSGADESEMIFKEHNFDFEELLDGSVDLYAGYTSNEIYILEKRGIPYKIFSPKNEGFDFYSDILFTSEKEFQVNPQRVEKFKKASLKGWEYAFDNIDETVKLIHKKYNPQNKTIDALLFEAIELKKLAYTDESKLGDISEKKILRIFDVYKIMGLAKNTIDVHELVIYNSSNVISAKEQQYLKSKKEIRICVLPSYLPYSGIEDDKYVGIGAGVLEIVSKHIPVPFKLVKTKSWKESIEKAKNRECDLLPVMQATPSRGEYFKFTDAYYEDPLVVVTNKSQNYILDIKTVLDKEFSVVSGVSFIEVLRDKYPGIKLNVVPSRKEGILGVKNGKYYGHIDLMMAAAYYMQHYSSVDLKISGQFEDNVKISFGIRNDDEMLFEIFEKIVKNLKPSDVQKVLNEWVSINYTNGSNYEYIKKIFILMFVLTAVFLYRQYLLNKKNQELEKLQGELVELNKSLESKIADAVSEIVKKDAYLLHQSRLAQMGEMLSMIAHQWKQPLSSISAMQIAIRMALELEKYDLNNEKQRAEFIEFLHQKLDKIGANTQNLSQIISDFSDFYKPNKKSEVMLLDNVIIKSCNLVQDNMDVNSIRMSLDLHSELLLRLHENEFMQVILNILSNAKDQLLNKNIENARIKLRSFDKDKSAILEISDNAGGIDESIISHIFDPYFSTKLEKNGTGLGLYMSKNIIEDYHNGSISVKNDKDGAVFVIKIQSEEI